MQTKMFCYQCQETMHNTGCTFGGVCGKKPTTADLQDLLIYLTKGLSVVTTRFRKENKTVSDDVNNLINLNLFMTITNANFDEAVLVKQIDDTIKWRDYLKPSLEHYDGLPDAATWSYQTVVKRIAKAGEVGVLSIPDVNIRSLHELITYGLKGMAAYNYHANMLGYSDPKINAFMQKTLAALVDDSLSEGELTELVLATGEHGSMVMALLDTANRNVFGNPEMTTVQLGVRKNPGILISGHDLNDLKMLLEQTKDQGIDRSGERRVGKEC